MGRRQVELTQEQRDAQRNHWFGERRNSRRREAYAANSDVRNSAIEASRKSYRERRVASGATVRHDEDCLLNLPRLASIGARREVLVNGALREVLTFRPEEFAEAVGRSLNVVYRWFSRELAPKPIVRCEHAYTDERGRIMPALVYTEQEVRAMMAVFSAHQKVSQYFREVHTDAAEAMHTAVGRVRTSYGLIASHPAPAPIEQRTNP